MDLLKFGTEYFGVFRAPDSLGLVWGSPFCQPAAVLGTSGNVQNSWDCSDYCTSHFATFPLYFIVLRDLRLLSSPWQVAWRISIGFRRSKSFPSCAGCFTQSCLYFPLWRVWVGPDFSYKTSVSLSCMSTGPVPFRVLLITELTSIARRMSQQSKMTPAAPPPQPISIFHVSWLRVWLRVGCQSLLNELIGTFYYYI